MLTDEEEARYLFAAMAYAEHGEAFRELLLDLYEGVKEHTPVKKIYQELVDHFEATRAVMPVDSNQIDHKRAARIGAAAMSVRFLHMMMREEAIPLFEVQVAETMADAMKSEQEFREDNV